MTGTRWSVSKHTFNSKKHLLSKQEQDSHVHGGNAAVASDAPANKRKATEAPEEDGITGHGEEQIQPRSKRLRRLPDGPTDSEDTMALPVTGLPAHGSKRKSRDEEEEDVPAEGSNKRRMSSGRIVEK